MNKPSTSLGKIVRIMKIVVRQMENQTEPKRLGLPLVQKLVKRGFTPEDVSVALQWLALLGMSVPETENDTSSRQDRPGTFRMLHPSESIRLHPDAQKLMLTLLETGKLSPLHFERVIQYIVQNDLREVSPVRLEVILDLANPDPQPARTPPLHLSHRLPPPAFLN